MKFLLFIYSLIIMRGFYICIQARDTFSRLMAGSIVMTFFVYVFVNIGMVNGILPVVGIPLPLISYGGSSLWVSCAAIGIVLRIAYEVSENQSGSGSGSGRIRGII